MTKEEERRRVTSGTARTATFLLTKGVAGARESVSYDRRRHRMNARPRHQTPSRAALDPRNFPPVDDVPPVDDEPPVAEDEPRGRP